MSLKKDSGSFTGSGVPDDLAIDPRTAQEVEEEQDAHVGVKTVEAAEKVYGKYSKWFLFLGGLQLLTQVIIADITTLKWRGLVSALTSAPFIINAFVGANISTQVLEHSNWRWGYGMFAILIPISLSPLIVTLFWAEQKAKKLGLVDEALRRAAPDYAASIHTQAPITTRIWRLMEQMDLVGLVLVASIIAMLVIGIVLLFVFSVWETWFAKRPVVPLRFLRNRSFIGAAWIGFFDFVSFYLTNTYLYSFVLVVKPWSLINVTYFTSTQTVALTVFGIMAGVIMRFTHRYKWLLFTGLCIRLLGVGLMIHTRGANSSDAEIVWTQLLQGIGGGFASVTTQVGAQASVPHADVAVITAIVLLWTEIGGSVGSAIAGAVWANVMPEKLAKYLPQLSEADRSTLFGSITSVTEYPRGNPIREGVISAYDDTMKILCIAATCISVIPILFSLIMPDWYLGDKQNAVDSTDLAGERSSTESELSDRPGRQD
ncbi:hypothetical protein PHLCEN_2v3966 [Hermanssonia centrifuga]|uniref:Uncharacterized protein n=1 Tax=Hermanssonia centrifuga TaxID=98765 RepID=A0A2R6Q7K3_9APHY|nr:hypothetical protein PHLCEN_2v3966 [Hermanssonia centrifuga]